ncbi:RNA polymerase sigma factor [Actinocorallia sp. A-T 12471]|uniref:RNA polymerase sigma factor n=1 Tax=Actinocorallia sp. A-T 12471 TaxID=3089813 RepID=UPI0029D2AAFC|nr:RNA polymerase sigma factor [Actinocorallia sp. A-T 12471]MDX6740880.1 RNA polymerase sigma factor [Actinocorallia sp. A-T 12471]
MPHPSPLTTHRSNPAHPPPDDATSIADSLTHPETFALVFDRHADEIHAYVSRRLGPDLADDIVSDTFLTAFRKRRTYDPTRPDARPWLYGIASRLIRDHHRSETRHNRLLARTPAPGPAEPFDDRSAARVTSQRLQPRLARVLARLSADDRDLLLLIAWADLTYEECAIALGIPVGTVRSRLHRVRAKIRRAFGGVDPTGVFEEGTA